MFNSLFSTVLLVSLVANFAQYSHVRFSKQYNSELRILRVSLETSEKRKPSQTNSQIIFRKHHICKTICREITTTFQKYVKM
jgi:hypothetical protein